MTEWCQQVVYTKMKCFCCNKEPNWAGKENSLNEKYDTNCTMWYVLIYEMCGISEMFAVLLLLFVFLSVLK